MVAKSGGLTLIVAGLGVFSLGFFSSISLAGGPPVALMLLGMQGVMLGTGLFYSHTLLHRTSQTEEALRFQYDIGYEAGWRDRGHADKPTLVDLSAYRENAMR